MSGEHVSVTEADRPVKHRHRFRWPTNGRVSMARLTDVLYNNRLATTRAVCRIVERPDTN